MWTRRASIAVFVTNITFHFLVTVATKVINVPVVNLVCRLYICARPDFFCLVNELLQFIRCCSYVRVCWLFSVFQEASNPPKGGHQLKSYEPQRKPPSWLSRCSLLWQMDRSFHIWPPCFVSSVSTTCYLIVKLDKLLIQYLFVIHKTNWGIKLFIFITERKVMGQE